MYNNYGYGYGYPFIGAGTSPPLPQPPDWPPEPQFERGQGQSTSLWNSIFGDRHLTEAEQKAETRTYGLSAIGSVAGAVLWKEHRIWGFILGGMAGGGLGKLLFAPPSGFGR